MGAQAAVRSGAEDAALDPRAADDVRTAAGNYAARRTPSGAAAAETWADDRTIAAMRLLLAGSAFVVTAVTERGEVQVSLISVLALYAAYGSAVFLAGRRGAWVTSSPWIDLGWYTALTAFGGGATSPFFSFYYFAILVASFRGGLRQGVQITIASALLFSGAAYLVGAEEGRLPLNRFILRPIYLLIIGLLMARWGNFELLLKRRLLLLKEVSMLANPRFGEGQTIGSVLERLREFYGAAATVLVAADAECRDLSVRQTRRGAPGSGVVELPVAAALGTLLTRAPWTDVIVFGRGAVSIAGMAEDAGETRRRPADADREWGAAVAEALNCASFVSVPVRYGAQAMARVYVTSDEPAAFDDSDGDFLLMVFDHVMPAVERLRLLDRLAVNATVNERQRLARDLHDSVIQPYIGLQIGVGAALSQVRAGADPTAMLERLLHLTDREIASLRTYARDLKERRQASGGLVAGVRRIAAGVAEAADIDVAVDAPDELIVEDRVAAEVFQIVAEGLSNIRRHTTARCAHILLERVRDAIVIRIANPGLPGVAFRPFVPRSITDRAQALGGSARVSARPDGGALVEVTVPL